MRTTYEQAVRLKALGYNMPCNDIYWIYDDSEEQFEQNYGFFDWNTDDDGERCISAPTVHEALQWIRGEKKIHCAAALYPDVERDGYYYEGEFVTRSGGWVRIKISNDYKEAECDLLDAILDYLENKK